MQGLDLFVHAVRMVIGNFPAALRLGAVLFAALFVLMLVAGPGPAMHMGAGPAFPSPLGFVAGALQIVFGLWVAVAWHRYILLEEQPGTALPRWDGAAVWAYFKAALIVFLVVFVILIPLVLLGSLLLLPLIATDPMNPPLLVSLLGLVIFYVPAAYVGYRIAPMLPAAAIGQPMTLAEARAATASSGAAFIVLALVSLLAGWLIGLPGFWLARVSFVLGLLWSVATSWLTVLVGASILTTIHGHYVQGRPLHG